MKRKSGDKPFIRVVRCVRYNLSALFSLIFSPEKFRLFSWWEILGLIIFLIVTGTMLALSV